MRLTRGVIGPCCLVHLGYNYSMYDNCLFSFSDLSVWPHIHIQCVISQIGLLLFVAPSLWRNETVHELPEYSGD